MIKSLYETKRLPGIYEEKGELRDIGSIAWQDGEMADFIISGGSRAERMGSVENILRYCAGRYPVVILHTGDGMVEDLIGGIWNERKISGNGLLFPLWILNERKPEFEPFWGMSRMQVIAAVRQVAERLNYMVSPRLDEVVEAHMDILKLLNLPVSLSGIYYLCRFRNLREFYENIFSLPCPESEAGRIWACLGIDDKAENSPFYVFRSAVKYLAREAMRSGWSPDNVISNKNILSAIKERAVIAIPVCGVKTELLLDYLTEELAADNAGPFFFLTDDVRIGESELVKFLMRSNTGCFWGITGGNAVELAGGEDPFFLLAEKAERLVYFKHGTGKTAEILASTIGKEDVWKKEFSRGKNREFLNVFPRGYHRDERITMENRYRVMPEELSGLNYGQAIILDTRNDEVIYYN